MSSLKLSKAKIHILKRVLDNELSHAATGENKIIIVLSEMIWRYRHTYIVLIKKTFIPVESVFTSGIYLRNQACPAAG